MNTKKRERALLLQIMAVSIVLLLVLQLAGIFLFLYSRFWWLDILNHFIGGVFGGLFVIWFFYYSGYAKGFRIDRILKNRVAVSVFSVFVVAVLWEVYEYILGPFDTYLNYPLDTSKDIVVGSFGAFLSSVFYTKSRKTNEK